MSRFVLLKVEWTPRTWFTSSFRSTASSRSGTAFSVEILDDRPGILTFSVTGPKSEACFKNEPGGHRWQRISPTEKRGRVHTSTVTVAVLPDPTELDLPVISDRDLEWAVCRGTGAGGQKRNKTETTVVLKHLPTGLQVRCEDTRSQQKNRVLALQLLRAKLWELKQKDQAKSRAQNRKQQVGCGMRGEKRRTIRVQDGVVTDHILGKRWNLRSYLRGEWEYK